jgi:hypothetical protein
VICDDQDPRDNPERETDDREIGVDRQDDQIEIESVSKVNGATDKFKFKLKVNDDGGLSASVVSESRDTTFYNKQSLSVYFDKIVSYSGGGFYAGGNNIVGAPYNLDTNWNPFVCNNGDPKYVCSVSTRDGVFAATFEFAGKSFPVGNMTITPSDLKITVTIQYPYAANASATDRIAVEVFGKAKSSYITTPNNVEAKKLVNTGTSAFTWIDYALADNVNVTVASSPVLFTDEGEDRKFGLWFSFDANKPAQIVWDPTVSTDNTSSIFPLL